VSGQVRACLWSGVEVVVPTAVQQPFPTSGAEELHGYARTVVVTHTVVFIETMPTAVGVRSRQLDGPEGVRNLMSLNGVDVAPAFCVDASECRAAVVCILLAGAVVIGDVGDAAVNTRVHPNQVLAVGAVKAEGHELRAGVGE